MDCAVLLNSAGLPHFRTYVRSYKVHASSPVAGRVVTQYPGDRTALHATNDFTKIYAELMAVWAGATPTPNTKLTIAEESA